MKEHEYGFIFIMHFDNLLFVANVYNNLKFGRKTYKYRRNKLQ